MGIYLEGKEYAGLIIAAAVVGYVLGLLSGYMTGG